MLGHNALFTLLIAFLLPLLALGQEKNGKTMQDEWLAPGLPDLSTNITAGSQYTIRWTKDLQNWRDTFCPGCNVHKVDLYAQGEEMAIDGKVVYVQIACKSGVSLLLMLK